MMPMNEVILRQRKLLGLTQEQVADRLGVTPPAVHKWEKGINCPDVELLPPLARLLKTDVNELLCFSDELSAQELTNLMNQSSERMQSDGIEAAYQMLSDAVREYPRCAPLLHQASLMLRGFLIMSGMTGEEKEPYEQAAWDWTERAAKDGDEETKKLASHLLVSRCLELKEYDKAQELIDSLPERSTLDKELQQANLYRATGKLPEAIRIWQKKVLQSANDLQLSLTSLAEVQAENGEPENARYTADTCKKVIELLLWSGIADFAPLSVAVAEKDTVKAADLLRSVAEALQKPYDLYERPLYDRLITKSPDKTVQKDAISKRMAEIMMKPLLAGFRNESRYRFLMEDDGFCRLVEKYEKEYI